MTSCLAVYAEPGLVRLGEFVERFAEQPCIQVACCVEGVGASLHGLWGFNGSMGTFGDLSSSVDTLHLVEEATGVLMRRERCLDVLETIIGLTCAYFRRHGLLAPLDGQSACASRAAERLVHAISSLTERVGGYVPSVVPQTDDPVATLLLFEQAMQLLSTSVSAPTSVGAASMREEPFRQVQSLKQLTFLQRPEHAERRRVLSRLVDEVQDLDSSIHSLLLYGSMARGNATPSSDIDLLLVLSDSLHEDPSLLSQVLERVVACREVLRQSSQFSQNDPVSYLFEREIPFLNPFFRSELVNDAIPILGCVPRWSLYPKKHRYDEHLQRFAMMADFHAVRQDAAKVILSHSREQLLIFLRFLCAHHLLISRYTSLGAYQSSWMGSGIPSSVLAECFRLTVGSACSIRTANTELVTCITTYLDHYRELVSHLYALADDRPR